MSQILAILGPLMMRLMASRAAELLLLRLAADLAKRTDSNVDDQLVAAVAEAIGLSLPSDTPPKGLN